MATRQSVWGRGERVGSGEGAPFSHGSWSDSGLAGAELDLVGLVYRAALDEEQWRPLLDGLLKATGASAGTLWLRASGSGPEVAFCVGDDAELQRIFDETRAQGEGFAELSSRRGIGGSLVGEEGATGFLVLVRARRSPPFGEGERDLVTRLLVHLNRACLIRSRISDLKRSRTAPWHALDRLPFGVVLCDGTAMVLDRNRAAERILAAGDGLGLRDGRLVAAFRHEHESLKSLLAGACSPVPGVPEGWAGALTVSRPSLSRPYSLLVVPLHAERPPSVPRRWSPEVLVLLTDPEVDARLPAELLRACYDLTRAETGLAGLLLRGLSVEECAAELGVSRNTIRTHLQHLFDKTGTTRQAELLRLLLTLPLAMEDRP